MLMYWRGNYSRDETKGSDKPTDEDFKAHFEGVLNPQEVTGELEPNIMQETDVTIPILDDAITTEEGNKT